MTAEPTARKTSGEADPGGPPPYDAAALGRVVPYVELRAVELVGVYFDRADDGPFAAEIADTAPELGIGVEWELAPSGDQLGCVLSFATLFEGDEPYQLHARFRAQYTIEMVAAPTIDDVQQFVYWNAVFNVWPYWREYLSSTINRAGLPRFVAPVMRVPR